jgi:hypothetical protein
MSEIDFNNVMPPVETYGHVGNPFKSTHEYISKNIQEQNNLNNKHGGRKTKRKITKRKNTKRKNTKRKNTKRKNTREKILSDHVEEDKKLVQIY